MTVIETRASAILVGNIVPLVFAAVFVLARFYSRAVILRAFHIDDYILLVAWVCAVVLCIWQADSVNYGAGRHEKDITFAELKPFLLSQYTTRLFYQATTSVTKLSLCVMYLRIFGTSRASKYFLWSILALVSASLIALEFVNIFQCKPIDSVWNVEITGKCINDVPGFWISAMINILVDVALLVFSAIQVAKLNMRIGQKVLLLLTIGIGWMTVVAALLRVVRIAAVIKDSTDAPWRTYDTSIWSAVEVNVGLLCTAAPAIKPLLVKIAPTFMYSIAGKTGSRTAATGGKNGTGKRNTLNATFITGLEGDEMAILGGNEDKAHDGILKSTQITVSERDAHDNMA